jgi:TusA-related sulfurtransferase
VRELNAIQVDDHHYQVDMRGWVCPYPKYAVEGLVRKFDRGRLDLLVDCPSATEDVPKVVKAMGCSVTEINQIGGGEWQIVITK